MENVFVTVGTTLFEELVETVVNPSCLQALYDIGCRHLSIQYGKGSKPEITAYKDMSIEAFDYKPSIHDYQAKADLIISHAGSGSVLESLWLKKTLLVVINERLMHNHQVELAEEMQARGYLFYGNCQSLRDLLLKSDFSKLKPYKHEHHAKRFPEFLDRIMGFES